MSTNDDNDLVQLWRHPVAWMAGGVASLFGAFLAVGFDPFGAGGQVILVLIQHAGDIFQALSILGFVAAPELPNLPAKEIQAAALFFGLIVVAKIVDSVWETVKDRL